MAAAPRERRVFLGLLSWSERSALATALRTETVGGLVLLAAAVLALVWANSPWGGWYTRISEYHFGIGALGLDLSVAHWTADGLLTIFFLVAGIELKRELVIGELRTPATAALPVIAALCGMVLPAAVYLSVTGASGGDSAGWAVPMATDIAFALAVLAVLNTHLPAALRAFLLTLAVVDDLGAIAVIAVAFADDLKLLGLGGAVIGLIVFAALQRFRVRGWWWYVPLGITIWALTYVGGVHATVAGVCMGLLLRATPDADRGEVETPAAHAAHLLRPISAGIAAPLFALFAAGVTLSTSALGEVFTRPESLGVVLGLVIGKIVGIFGGTWLAVKFTRAQLNPELQWADVFALSTLAGIGFTVSLLIGELSFPTDSDHIKAAVLVGSLIAAVLAAVLVKRRNGIYRRLYEAENIDENADGIPDVYQRNPQE
ncbi:Na+/H+ antiporter NhaA [Nocardia otitidiscaviarum]|uniref:Na(+)/H(+) antiporter NhaA n=1 Tax=Nocardia otitidiscaviarum TaxID=1823 RepID=A0A516NIC4_9NOCA|nr:Na+/H+ antiporter NhaA [Nocardia otitidiscaviarum]MCP9618960.1 Na+/H+ antiporter NhaA [Nocardia otitidiscaviarum]QDP78654.1 Na+/H+ antiporter NhaA [Nocardia otitidiscaviarum]